MSANNHLSGSGILLLDKPRGITSNAALGRAKRVLGIKKAGHTGTLDPMASGLLALCFGEATKVSAFLLDGDKAYLAEVTLGVTTDSEDAEGQVLEEKPVPVLDEAAIETVLDGFRGPIEQVPPMFSALKHQGKRLYELARKGEQVERPPRAVTIHDLELLGFDGQRMRLAVSCSKGTYIRSLARDIGQALGCGAHLSALRRTGSAPFSIEQAVDLELLDELDREQARALLRPADIALPGWPQIRLDDVQAVELRHGRPLSGLEPAPPAGLVRVYAGGQFMAIAESDGRGGLKSRRLFHPDGS
ncbi:MAG: tRNA pseudouridine(55) synthase TruB [Wenzhouxiangella sp.]